jgi:hypothetical protein
MKILYLGCHAVNDFEDIELFNELGHQVVAQGTYNNPASPGDDMRPAIPDAYYNPEMAKLAATLNWDYEKTSIIPSELIAWCDAVYILCIQIWLPFNWPNIKKKTVIFRSNGQSVPSTEAVLSRYRREGLKIVRYSPLETRIPGYVGQDAMIRFYKDEDEYNGWNGKTEKVITVAQSMKARGQALHFDLFEKVTRGLPRTLYGSKNEDAGALSGGSRLTYEQLKQVYRDNRVFFYTGTYPAQYTMAFQEAFMCFPSKTRVITPEILQTYERKYSGTLIKLESEHGLECECTPNHPFLTAEGWKEAKDINTGSMIYATTYGWNKDLDPEPIGDIVERVQTHASLRNCQNDRAHRISRLLENEKIGDQDAFWRLLEDEVDFITRIRNGILSSNDRWRRNNINTKDKINTWKNKTLPLCLSEQHKPSVAETSENVNSSFRGLHRQTKAIFETSSGNLHAQGLNLLFSIQGTFNSINSEACSDADSPHVDRRSPTSVNLLRIFQDRYGIDRRNSLVKPQRIRKVLKTHATNIEVYNLRTRTGIYFANGFLVHNCGMPVVSIGKSLAGFDLEVPEFIENGVTGFTSDNLRILYDKVKFLLDYHGEAQEISKAARQKAIELFGKEKIKHEWDVFFKSL